MPRIVDIPLGEWLPSHPDFKNPGCIVAENVIPSPGGYAPLRQLAETGITVNGAIKGAASLFDNSSNNVVVGGAGTRLFTKRGDTIAETTGYTAPAGPWDFCQFNDFVIATEINNDPQYLTDIDSDDTWSTLTGSPPRAKYCAKVNEFVIFGNVGSVPNRIQWSGFNNPAGSWTADRLTQAGSADLDMDLGPVQRIIGGRFGLIFQKYGIQRLSNIAPPQVWRTDIITKDRGAIAPFGVINAGYQVYFLAQDGFYVTNGADFQPIGTSRVNRWFFETADQTYISEVQAGIDWENECVFWAFSSGNSTTRNKIIIYSWAQNRWSSADIEADWLLSATGAATSLEDLETLYGTLEAIPESLDALRWRARDRQLSAFVDGGSVSQFKTFSGAPLNATWETGEFQASPGQRVFVSGVTLMLEESTFDGSAQLIVKDNQNAETTLTEKHAGLRGFCPVRGEGRKMRVRIKKDSGTEWNHAQSIQAEIRPAGTW